MHPAWFSPSAGRRIDPATGQTDGYEDLVDDNRVAMLFIFPGLEVFLRINGRGALSVSPDLLARLAEAGRMPKTAIVVSIDEVLFHCGKAINRAKLWSADAHIDRKSVPSLGDMKAVLTGQSKAAASEMDDAYYRSVRNDLY
jgi:hypothetical protein